MSEQAKWPIVVGETYLTPPQGGVRYVVTAIDGTTIYFDEWCGNETEAYGHDSLDADIFRMLTRPADASPLKALREALETCRKLLAGTTVGDVFDAGSEAIEAVGLNPWCINEGLASRDNLVSLDFIDAALALAESQVGA